MYVSLNHFAIHLILKQHCESTILQHKIKSFCVFTLKEHEETIGVVYHFDGGDGFTNLCLLSHFSHA